MWNLQWMALVCVSRAHRYGIASGCTFMESCWLFKDKSTCDLDIFTMNYVTLLHELCMPLFGPVVQSGFLHLLFQVHFRIHCKVIRRNHGLIGVIVTTIWLVDESLRWCIVNLWSPFLLWSMTHLSDRWFICRVNDFFIMKKLLQITHYVVTLEDPLYSRFPFLDLMNLLNLIGCVENITNTYLWLLLVKFTFHQSCLFK